MQCNGCIVGFFGRSGQYLNAIGVYTNPELRVIRKEQVESHYSLLPLVTIFIFVGLLVVTFTQSILIITCRLRWTGLDLGAEMEMFFMTSQKNHITCKE